MGGHVNVEIKARCADQDRIRDMLRKEGADFRGKDCQTDTYFNVVKGRLKLREGRIENQLIHYERGDEAGPKISEVALFRSEPGSPLKEVLVRALGVLVVVDKEREIYFIGNVKFHIDQVAGLGTFVEIEAIDSDGTIGRERLFSQCKHYLDLFGINDQDLVSVSYSDMLLGRR